jgi:nucleoside-diphosphate-sugar epimerase
MECVVLRAPLLYGPGVKGNFLRLMRAIDRGTLLPLASIKNRRSLLYVENLVDAIMLSLEHPGAVGNTYLVADDLGISTPVLIRAIAGAMDRPARLLPCPAALLDFAGRISGKSNAVSRLISSLEIDSGRIRSELGWTPHIGLAAGLTPTARWYYQQHRDGRSA